MPNRSRYGIPISPYQDPRTWKMTPAMIRARQPFFWKNLATFGLLSSIAGGVYYYTVLKLSRDDFADIPVPPIEENELKQLQQEYEAKKHAEGKK